MNGAPKFVSGPPVIFQEVVHSICSGEAGCDEQLEPSEDRMDIHKNARLAFRSREALARYVLEQGASRKAAAAAFRVSPRTAGKWVVRFQGPVWMG